MENRLELKAAWKIGLRLWTRDYERVHEANRGFDWSPEAREFVASLSDLYTKKIIELLYSTYSSISIQDVVTVKKQAITTMQKIDSSKLQRLTKYVFHDSVARPELYFHRQPSDRWSCSRLTTLSQIHACSLLHHRSSPVASTKLIESYGASMGDLQTVATLAFRRFPELDSIMYGAILAKCHLSNILANEESNRHYWQ